MKVKIYVVLLEKDALSQIESGTISIAILVQHVNGFCILILILPNVKTHSRIGKLPRRVKGTSPLCMRVRYIRIEFWVASPGRYIVNTDMNE